MEKPFGWAGKILRVDVSDGSRAEVSTVPYLSRFIGGRGIASRLYWEETGTHTGAFDPGNHLFFMNGPLSGTPAPASSRWIVLGKSPMAVPEQYASGNLGGRLGAALKWTGLDGLIVTGASRKPVILVIEPGGTCRIEDASSLWGRDVDTTIASLEDRYGAESSVATIGTAGEKKVRFATVMSSGGAAATKGFGAVMGSKQVKAIVVRTPAMRVPVARPESLRQLLKEITVFWRGDASSRYWNEMVIEGTEKVKNESCYSCPGICRRGIYRNQQGIEGHRKTCVSAYFYSKQEMDRIGKMSDATYCATQLANRYGLCILELRFLVTWLPEALRKGIISETETGLKADEIGTLPWVEKLMSLILSRQGIGDLLAEGSRRATRHLGAEELIEGLVTRTGFDADYYSPRLFITNAPIYATEPVYPITQLHRISFPLVKWMVWLATEGMMGFLTTEKLRHLAGMFWGSEQAAEFDTLSGKSQAAVQIQNRAYAMENSIFCDWFWPIDYSGNVETGVGDPSLEARLFSAVTGVDMEESDYLRSGERCMNLCRAIYFREGRRGRVDDTIEEFNFLRPLEIQDPPVGLFNPEFTMPGKEGTLFSRMGGVVEREAFREIMDGYYRERGWDVKTGLFTRPCLKRLDLDDLIPELAGKGWVAD